MIIHFQSFSWLHRNRRWIRILLGVVASPQHVAEQGGLVKKVSKYKVMNHYVFGFNRMLYLTVSNVEPLPITFF